MQWSMYFSWSQKMAPLASRLSDILARPSSVARSGEHQTASQHTSLTKNSPQISSVFGAIFLNWVIRTCEQFEPMKDIGKMFLDSILWESWSAWRVWLPEFVLALHRWHPFFQISSPVTIFEFELDVLMTRRTMMLGSLDVEWCRTCLIKLSIFMNVVLLMNFCHWAQWFYWWIMFLDLDRFRLEHLMRMPFFRVHWSWYFQWSLQGFLQWKHFLWWHLWPWDAWESLQTIRHMRVWHHWITLVMEIRVEIWIVGEHLDVILFLKHWVPRKSLLSQWWCDLIEWWWRRRDTPLTWRDRNDVTKLNSPQLGCFAPMANPNGRIVTMTTPREEWITLKKRAKWTRQTESNNAWFWTIFRDLKRWWHLMRWQWDLRHPWMLWALWHWAVSLLTLEPREAVTSWSWAFDKYVTFPNATV